MACSTRISPPSPTLFLVNTDRKCNRTKFSSGQREISRRCRAMVLQTAQGPSAAYAKEMERLSAKESLLLAFKEAGGFQALVTGKTTNVQRIDVNERIVSLERLNPTPRPTTRFPQTLANLSKLNLVIRDGYANISASVKLLNSIESSFIVSTRLSVEGPLRMKEEYIEGTFESPKVNEESIPEQLRGAFSQAAAITDALAGGLKIPLGGTFERLFMISYLDEEILIIRDTAGVLEVLTRLDPGPSPVLEPIAEYES